MGCFLWTVHRHNIPKTTCMYREIYRPEKYFNETAWKWTIIKPKMIIAVVYSIAKEVLQNNYNFCLIYCKFMRFACNKQKKRWWSRKIKINEKSEYVCIWQHALCTFFFSHDDDIFVLPVSIVFFFRTNSFNSFNRLFGIARCVSAVNNDTNVRIHTTYIGNKTHGY